MTGLVYYHPRIYQALMRLLYGGQYETRYRVIAELVPEGARLNDICCGDCYIYFKYLKQKKVQYRGFDNNPVFINWLKARGVEAELLDVTGDRLPAGDFLLLQASLYQFIPCHEDLLTKLLESDHQTVIVSEPIRNLSSSSNFIIRNLAQWATASTKGKCRSRFTPREVMDLFEKFRVSEIKEAGRDLVGVFTTAGRRAQT